MKKKLVVIRGAGELATGIAHRLHNTGYSVLMLEKEAPSAIRRSVVFAEAVYDGEKRVERVTCYKANNLHEAEKLLKKGEVTIMVDPEGECLHSLKPHMLVDAIYAKRNLGTHKDMANFTVAVGPGFIAGKDVDCVIETTRGHNLGWLIYEGQAQPEKETIEVRALMRASHAINAPCDGHLEAGHPISYIVKKNETIAKLYMEGGNVFDIKAPVEGVLRGLLHDGCPVRTGLKIAEIDPSTRPTNCMTISAKSRCISGSVLEALMIWESSQVKKSKFPWRK